MTRDDVNPSDYPAGTVIHNHPDWKYHAAPGLSSSALKTFVKQSPRHYQTVDECPEQHRVRFLPVKLLQDIAPLVMARGLFDEGFQGTGGQAGGGVVFPVGVVVDGGSGGIVGGVNSRHNRFSEMKRFQLIVFIF